MGLILLTLGCGADEEGGAREAVLDAARATLSQATMRTEVRGEQRYAGAPAFSFSGAAVVAQGERIRSTTERNAFKRVGGPQAAETITIGSEIYVRVPGLAADLEDRGVTQE